MMRAYPCLLDYLLQYWKQIGRAKMRPPKRKKIALLKANGLSVYLKGSLGTYFGLNNTFSFYVILYIYTNCYSFLVLHPSSARRSLSPPLFFPLLREPFHRLTDSFFFFTTFEVRPKVRPSLAHPLLLFLFWVCRSSDKRDFRVGGEREEDTRKQTLKKSYATCFV